jgi:lipopolysaccharide export system protein LptA
MILFLCFNLNAEENELRPYRLINADKLIVKKVNEEVVTNLIGKVHIFYGDTEFFADTADLFEKQNIARLWGNVQVFDDSLSLYADRVDYYRETEKLFLDGNVFAEEAHVDSTIRTFDADHVEYFRKEREFYARDNVYSYDQRENIHAECGRLNYYLNDGYGYLLVRPQLQMIDQDSLIISAEKIEYFKDYEKVVATFNVETVSGDFKMNSDFLLYFADEEKAIYQGNPSFESDFADAVAMEFQIYFGEQKISRAMLLDSCHVKFKTANAEEKNSWVTGDQIEFNFEDGKITFCDAQFNVSSYFHQKKTDSRDFTINEATGIRLLINISEGNKIDTIDMYRSVQGMYKFKKK